MHKQITTQFSHIPTARAILMREQPLESRARRALIVVVCASVALYAYLAGASVINAIVAKSAERSASSAHAELAQLERVYSNLSAAVNAERGPEFGLVPAERTHFVERTVHLGKAW